MEDNLDALLDELAEAQMEDDRVFAAHPIVRPNEADPYLCRANPVQFKEETHAAYRRMQRAIRKLKRYAIQRKGLSSRLLDNEEASAHIEAQS